MHGLLRDGAGVSPCSNWLIALWRWMVHVHKAKNIHPVTHGLLNNANNFDSGRQDATSHKCSSNVRPVLIETLRLTTGTFELLLRPRLLFRTTKMITGLGAGRGTPPLCGYMPCKETRSRRWSRVAVREFSGTREVDPVS